MFHDSSSPGRGARCGRRDAAKHEALRLAGQRTARPGARAHLVPTSHGGRGRRVIMIALASHSLAMNLGLPVSLSLHRHRLELGLRSEARAS